MSEWYEIFSFSIVSVALMLSVLGIWFTAIFPTLDKWSKKFFLAYFTILMLCSLISLADVIFYRYVGAMTQVFFGFLEILFLSMPLPMITAFLIHCCKKDIKSNIVFRVVLGFWAAFFLLLISTFFTKHIYYISPNEQFQRGAWFPIMIVPLNVITVLNFVCLIRWRKLISRKYYYGFLIATVPLAVTLLVHTVVDVTALIDISTVLSAVSMFGLILSAQIEQNLRQQCEITRQQQEIAYQRASVMVLQMRPHFIYNTLMSIYYLIAQDTEKAQKITLDFSTYLRKNFTALAKDNAIPFTEELEHTRAYLAVEKTRFEDHLFVEFDTPHTHFRIPPLTLQPIVENAIKHGLDPELNPLYVTIKTSQSESGSIITVEDTGPGFGDSDNNEPHIALANIKERLKMMCSGTLTVSAGKSGGTKVIVFVPNKVKQGDRKRFRKNQ